MRPSQRKREQKYNVINSVQSIVGLGLPHSSTGRRLSNRKSGSCPARATDVQIFSVGRSSTASAQAKRPPPALYTSTTTYSDISSLHICTHARCFKFKSQSSNKLRSILGGGLGRGRASPRRAGRPCMPLYIACCQRPNLASLSAVAGPCHRVLHNRAVVTPHAPAGACHPPGDTRHAPPRARFSAYSTDDLVCWCHNWDVEILCCL